MNYQVNTILATILLAKKWFIHSKSVMTKKIKHIIWCQLEQLKTLPERTGKRFLNKWDADFLEFFARENDFEEKYRQLFRYFVTGLQIYSSRLKSRIYYPGLSSRHGAVLDGLEGFSRQLPLLSVWLASGRESRLLMLDGRRADVREIISKGIRNGVMSGHGFWGDAVRYCQRIVEAHDIAISAWLLRSQWDALLNPAETRSLVRWFERAAEKKCCDDNWHLFICVIDAVMITLGWGGNSKRLQNHFSRIKDFYLKCGWFTDGSNGKVDFYNAWGFHYSLFWLQKIMPDFESEFIHEAQKIFFSSYQYLITPSGAPLMGRSLIYRLAVSVPYLIAAHQGVASLGLAKRAFDTTWSYYVKYGALSRGRLTQGIFFDNPAILDNYSGPGSSFWGLRSFILALLFEPRTDFWMCPMESLPIEKGSYEINIPELGWIIKGDQGKQVVTIIKNEGLEPGDVHFKAYTLKHWLKEKITAQVERPTNWGVKYDLKVYSSSKDFQDAIFRNINKPGRPTIL